MQPKQLAQNNFTAAGSSLRRGKGSPGPRLLFGRLHARLGYVILKYLFKGVQSVVSVCERLRAWERSARLVTMR